MITYEKWRHFNRWLISLQEKHIPQGFVLASGLGSIGFGVLFLIADQRIDESTAMRFLTNAVPTPVWVVVFLVLGALMCAMAVARYHWSAPLSFLFAIVMHVFAILTAVDVFTGPAAGLLMLFALVFGWLNVLSTVLAIAPLNEHVASSKEGHGT